MRYFAIGLRDWVEIRSAQAPPRPHTSHLIVTVTVPRERMIGRDTWGFPQWVYTEEKIKKKVPHTCYVGGKVLSAVKKRGFCRKFGVSVPRHSCIELTAEQADAILKGTT